MGDQNMMGAGMLIWMQLGVPRSECWDADLIPTQSLSKRMLGLGMNAGRPKMNSGSWGMNVV